MSNVVPFKVDVRESIVRDCTHHADAIVQLLERFYDDKRLLRASELIVDAMTSINCWGRDDDFLAKQRYKRRGVL